MDKYEKNMSGWLAKKLEYVERGEGREKIHRTVPRKGKWNSSYMFLRAIPFEVPVRDIKYVGVVLKKICSRCIMKCEGGPQENMQGAKK